MNISKKIIRLIKKNIFFILILTTLIGFSLTLNYAESDNKGYYLEQHNNDEIYYNGIPLSEYSEIKPIASALESQQSEISTNDTIMYNLATSEEVVENLNYTVMSSITETESWEPYDGPLTESIIDVDDRDLISNTDEYPWSTICKLYMDFNGTGYIGSGALIDRYHVLTAAHCVYYSDEGGWVDGITVVPGQNGTYEPFGNTYATYIRTFSQYISTEDIEYDMAVITLADYIGDSTGWMGMKTREYNDTIYTGTLNTAGYPGDLDSGKYMYFDSDVGRNATERLHWYYMDTAGGQSGSPVWQYTNDHRYILSVHTCGDDGTGSNHGTRLDQFKFDKIMGWLEEDKKPDLVSCGDDYAGITPDRGSPGLTPFSAWTKIENIGEADASEFNVSFYLSWNEIISNIDYFLGNYTCSSLAEGETVNATISGIIPESIPTDLYYFGWVIDGNNSIDEEEESNNYDYQTSYLYQIDADNPTNPDCCFGGDCYSGIWQDDVNEPNLSWFGAQDAISGVLGYYVYWGTNSTGESNDFQYIDMYYPDIVTESGSYYLRVSTMDGVGNCAEWETIFVFNYDNNEPGNPNQCSTEGCSSDIWQNSINNPEFTWTGGYDEHSGVAGYNTYWGDNPLGESTNFQTEESYIPTPISESGVYYLRVQTIDNVDNSTDWKTIYTFKYDCDNPTNPDSCTLFETTSLNDIFENNSSVPEFAWSGEDDAHSGIDGYYLYWGNNSGGVSSNYQTENTFTPNPLNTSGIYYLRLKTKDIAGNVASWKTLLTYRFDCDDPINPYNCLISGCISGTWQNDLNNPQITWTNGIDLHTGIAGYYVYWGTDSSGVSSNYQTEQSLIPTPLTTSGSYYLRINTVDNVGNDADWETLYVFNYDQDAPINPVSCDQLVGSTTSGISQKDVTNPQFSWSTAEDKDSGVVGYYVYWGTDESGESDSFRTDNIYAPASITRSGSYYLRVQTEDEAGNKSEWKTLYVFVYQKPISLVLIIGTAAVVGTASIITITKVVKKRKLLKGYASPRSSKSFDEDFDDLSSSNKNFKNTKDDWKQDLEHDLEDMKEKLKHSSKEETWFTEDDDFKF